MTLPTGRGVLLVGHGTVSDPRELSAFLSRIRRGRPFAPALVDELARRYARIGGSPLLENTQRQAARLAGRLGLPVLTGMRYAAPEIEDALVQVSELGLDEVCVLPLAPFGARAYLHAVASEMERLRRIGALRPFRLVPVESWSAEPLLIEAHKEAIGKVLSSSHDSPALVMTAHSLPLAAMARGEPYPERVRALADAIATELGAAYELAYQSQGQDGGEWLGPDLRSVIQGLGARGARHVLVAPIGFLADHVETLYDLDVEAAGFARQLGLGFTRILALNASPGLVEAMARVVEKALLGQPSG
ncbi:MAG: ferrochelatase [Polyangiaceae bacterium]|nr:ferrochelatase [Polyangiaceae bacterium]